MDTEIKPKEEVVVDQKPVQNNSQPRGGFMNGGLPTTFLFLLAFFLVSFYAGVLAQKGSSDSSTSPVKSRSQFNATGFKKLAGEIKLDQKKFDSCLDSGKFAADVKRDLDEGVGLKISGTPTFIVNGTALVGAQPLSVFEAAIENGTFPFDKESTSSGTLYDGQKITQNIPLGDKGRIRGDDNAKVTIIEYSDFECPYCAKFYSETQKAIEEKYIKTGKAKLVFKDFPLTNIHPNANKAAEAARCAQEQGKFWQMHDKLFELKNSQT
ncbi:MAG: thioredoxin domain-containing protein [bacterium]|nr:thioredoxin domain-containing protein [bacterium]